MDTDDGWPDSASAWIADQGEAGDYSRRHVLDAPMLARVARSGARTALDVGCGEGRFCRMLAAAGIPPPASTRPRRCWRPPGRAIRAATTGGGRPRRSTLPMAATT